MGEHGNWRWTQWVLLMCSLGVYLPSLLMSETYKKIILQKRAKRRGHAIPAPPGGPSRAAMIKMLFTITLFRPVSNEMLQTGTAARLINSNPQVHMLFTEPIVAFFSIYIAFSFAVLFAFFAAFPIVFEGVYGFNTGQTGLTFLAVGLGVVIAAGLGIVTDRKMYQKRWQAARAEGKENIAPEHRLYAAMIGSFGLPVGLFWFAWTARTSVHWISPVLAAIPFAIGNLTIFVRSSLPPPFQVQQANTFNRLAPHSTLSMSTVRCQVRPRWPPMALCDTPLELHSRSLPFRVCLVVMFPFQEIPQMLTATGSV